MERIEISIGGRDFTFAVEFINDQDAGAPWENAEGHGNVRTAYLHEKRAGEMVLGPTGTRDVWYLYNFAEACRIALRDDWDAAPYNDGSETKRQQAAKAARADFEHLREWCNYLWSYVGVVVTMLDDEGEETEVSDSLWCVETRGDYHHERARLMADELASGYGVSWDEAGRKTYAYTGRAQA